MCVGETEPLPDELGLLDDIGDIGLSVYHAGDRTPLNICKRRPMESLYAVLCTQIIITTPISPVLDDWPQRDPMLSKAGMQSAHRVGLSWHVAVLQVDEWRDTMDMCWV